MADFNARQMLDWYIYDYFMKKNLPELAETFKNEANLEIHPNILPEINVPQGFLLEWWNGSYDVASFRGWVSQQENSSMEATQEHNNAISNGSMSPAIHERGNTPLAFSLPSHEDGEHNIYASPTGQKPESLYYSAQRTTNIGSSEESGVSTSEATIVDDDTSGTSDCTSTVAGLSTVSENPTVHQLDSNDKK